MKLYPVILSVFLSIFLPGTFQTDAGTRLAILTDDGSQPAAALLTTKLSKRNDMVLVERAEIDKVFNEQKLSAEGDLQHDLDLVGLLKADGVVFFQSGTINGKTMVSARLVAASPGVVIGAGLFGGPPEAVSESVALQFQSLWPKLAVARGDAIAVSLLNLRCVLGGSESIESQLTFLLAHQLMLQRDIFVLERWRMDDLVFEKNFTTWKEGDFWTGSYVAGGRIETSSNGNLTVTVVLQPPKGGAKQEIVATGTPQDLPTLADDLVSRIMKTLSKQPFKGEWNSKEEAAQYFNEAKWGFDAHLYSAAHSAAEASFALGNKDPQLLCLRSEIYAGLAYPPVTTEPRGTLRPTMEHPFHRGYNPEAVDVSMSDQYVRDAMQALDLFQDYAALHPPRGIKDEVTHAGVMALWSASRVLRNYFDHGLINGPAAGSLVELRRKTREAAAVVIDLDQHPVIFTGKGEPLYTNSGYAVKALYIPFWYDHPPEALDAYRELLRTHPDYLLKDYLASRHWLQSYVEECYAMPWLVGWNGEKPEELDKAWAGFLDSMESSTNIKDALNGRVLRVADAKTRDEKETAAAAFRDFAWKHRVELLQVGTVKTYFRCFEATSTHVPSGYTLRWLDYYLQNASRFDGDALSAIWHVGDIASPEQAAAIFDHWAGYKERVSAGEKLPTYVQTRLGEFESSLLSKYPQLAPAKKPFPKTIEVTNHWQPDGANGKLGHCVAWRDGRLWVAFTTELPSKGNEKPRYRVKFSALELPSFAVVESIETPDDIPLIENFRGPKFFVTPTSLFLQDDHLFHRYDRKLGTWTSFELPARSYCAYFARGDELYAAFSRIQNAESGILRWSASTSEIEVVASNRRRPGLHIFDDCPPYDVESLCGGPDGKLGAMIGKLYWHKPGGKQWDMPFPKGKPAFGPLFPVGNSYLLVSRRSGIFAVDNETGRITILPGSNFETADNTPPHYFPEAFIPDYASTGVAVTPSATAFEDGRLWTLRVDTAWQCWVLNHTERLDRSPPESTSAALAFRTAKSTAEAGTDPVIVKGKAGISLIATDSGMVFDVAGTDGLWFMPMKDFDPLLEAAE